MVFELFFVGLIAFCIAPQDYKSSGAGGNLFDLLEVNPTFGIHLGNDIYKIRLAIASNGKGKSGGARVMSYVKLIDETVYLFSIYNKGDKDNMTDKEAEELINQHFENIE